MCAYRDTRAPRTAHRPVITLTSDPENLALLRGSAGEVVEVVEVVEV